MVRRAAILGASPYLHDYYRFDASSLLRATGGNTGNLAFLYAVSEHLGPSVPFVSIETPINEIRDIADVLILPVNTGVHARHGARTVEVSSMRCRSPVDSDAPDRSRAR